MHALTLWYTQHCTHSHYRTPIDYYHTHLHYCTHTHYHTNSQCPQSWHISLCYYGQPFLVRTHLTTIDSSVLSIFTTGPGWGSCTGAMISRELGFRCVVITAWSVTLQAWTNHCCQRVQAIITIMMESESTEYQVELLQLYAGIQDMGGCRKSILSRISCRCNGY